MINPLFTSWPFGRSLTVSQEEESGNATPETERDFDAGLRRSRVQ